MIDISCSVRSAMALASRVRKGNWAIITDLLYMDLANGASKVKGVTGPGGAITLPINAEANMGVRTTVWTLAGSYTVARSPVGTFDVLGGFRYGGMKTSLDWSVAGPTGALSPSGGSSESVNLWDGIVGVRGEVSLGDNGNWYVPDYADIGAGNSNWTWQAYAGVGYRFDWGSVVLGFRNLSYDQSGGKPAQNVNLTGPLLAFNFPLVTCEQNGADTTWSLGRSRNPASAARRCSVPRSTSASTAPATAGWMSRFTMKRKPHRDQRRADQCRRRSHAPGTSPPPRAPAWHRGQGSELKISANGEALVWPVAALHDAWHGAIARAMEE